jgi:ketosteroid isomerase-like protein
MIRNLVPLLAIAILTTGALNAQSKEEDAIKAQLAAYAAARSSGSGEAQGAFYTDDADEWGSSEPQMTVGRAAIAKQVALPPDPNRKMRLEAVRIDFLTKEIALVNCTYGGTAADPTGHVLYVMQKRGGKWLIRSNRPQRFTGK